MHRILLVDDAPDVLSTYELLLATRYDVVTAQDALAGLEACRQEGPFAVVVSDYDMPNMSGPRFLQLVRDHWPDTQRILLTGFVHIDVAVEALNQGKIYSFLQKPCPVEHLIGAIDEAVERFQRRCSARERTNELQFSRDSLAHLAGTLEDRVGAKTRMLARLYRFAEGLNAALDLREIADLSALAASDVLEGRGVQVQLREGYDRAAHQEAHAGFRPPGARIREGIVADGHSLGAIEVDRHGPCGQDLTSTQHQLLSSIASSIAVAAHNEIRRQERDAAQHATILALAKLAERRDNETGRHLERVSRYSRVLAEGLRGMGRHLSLITDEYISNLYRSAPLHDIGKVGIPDAILLKPGKLDPEEWRVMKTHAEIGAETLHSVMDENRNQGFLQVSHDIALCHHERWDGGGYPHGLRGEEIPLAARILALADVYDALTTRRPYKEAWSHADAVAWISSCSGEHFDPDVVEAFLLCEAEALEISREFADPETQPQITRCDGD